MAIARNSALIEVAGTHLVFDVDPAQSALFNDSQSARVEAAIQTLRPGSTIAMTLLPPRGETPDQRRHRLKTEALYTARQAIDSDPLVNQIINEMGASVVEDSIRPNT
jgi:DNA polymerase-3 subunit gamma/tau